MSRTNHILGKFPWFYRKDDGTATNLHQLIRPFGEMLDQTEEDLLGVMRSHFVNKADNTGSEGLETSKKGDLDGIFSLYLQSLGGTSLLKQSNQRESIDDQEYTSRTIGLIKGLMGGASTKEGIRQIVAANLGLAEKEAIQAETIKRIEVNEFSPQFISQPAVTLPVVGDLRLVNENTIASPLELRLHVNRKFYADLKEVKLIHVQSGAFILLKGPFLRGDILLLQSDGRAFRNGTPIRYRGALPLLPPGESLWKFDARPAPVLTHFDQVGFDQAIFSEVGMGEPGYFEYASFDQAFFQDNKPMEAVVFDETFFDNSRFEHDDRAGFLTISYKRMHPATFQVSIPWDIPQSEYEMREPSIEARNGILHIVDKVKAAGVASEVAYKKEFKEDQGLEDLLHVRIRREEEAELKSPTFKIKAIQKANQGAISHKITDQLHLRGVFDHTSFDSLNTYS